MHLDCNSLLFLDTNVLIEHLFIPNSPASIIINYATKGVFRIGTCKQVIKEVEEVILRKVKQTPELLNIILERWTEITDEINLPVFPNATEKVIEETRHHYLAIMRHQADIPILASAIVAKPKLILSNNREHFNDIVSKKCKIPIYSCTEFLEYLEEITIS